MNAAKLMTAPAITVRENSSLDDAVRALVGGKVSGVPVVDASERLVGMLTEGDLLRRVEVNTGRVHWSGWGACLQGPDLNAKDYVRTHGRRVRDLMTRHPTAIAECTPLEDIVAAMEQHRVRRLPVVRGERVIGIVSRADVLRVIQLALEAPRPKHSSDDADILGQLQRELAGQSWFGGDVELSVLNGVVSLAGTVRDPAVHDAFVVAQEQGMHRAAGGRQRDLKARRTLRRGRHIHGSQA